jgi:hypothetical protein
VGGARGGRVGGSGGRGQPRQAGSGQVRARRRRRRRLRPVGRHVREREEWEEDKIE